jgi:hypothetical protein
LVRHSNANSAGQPFQSMLLCESNWLRQVAGAPQHSTLGGGRDGAGLGGEKWMPRSHREAGR